MTALDTIQETVAWIDLETLAAIREERFTPALNRELLARLKQANRDLDRLLATEDAP